MGQPDAAVIQELHQARGALMHIDATRRQLSAEQRRVVTKARVNRGGLVFVLVIIAAPMLFCGGSCAVVTVVGGEGVVVSDLPMFVFALGAPMFVIGIGWLLLRSHRRAVDRLAHSCAAVPPAAPGRPALCHVCGAPLVGAPEQGLARCNFCHADNIVDSRIMHDAARHQSVVVESMQHAVTREAAVLSSDTTATLTLTLVAALMSPVVAVLLMCTALFVLVIIPADVDQNESYAAVQISGTRCYGEVSKSAAGYSVKLSPRFPQQPDPLQIPAGNLERVFTKDLVGRQVLTQHNQAATVLALERSQADRRNRLRLSDTTSGKYPAEGMCEPPPNLRELATDAALESCAALSPQGTNVYLTSGAGVVYAVPKAGGTLTQLGSFPAGGASRFGNGRALHRTPSAELFSFSLLDPNPKPLSIRTGVSAMALAGERLAYTTATELLLEDASGGGFTKVLNLAQPVKALAANTTHLFYLDSRGIHQLPLTGGEPKAIDSRAHLRDFGLAGDYLIVNGGNCTQLPIGGGAPLACPFLSVHIGEYPFGSFFTDQDHGYFISSASNGRAGVHGFPLNKAGGFDRQYGPTSKDVRCAGQDAEHVYWVENNKLLRDKKQQE